MKPQFIYDLNNIVFGNTCGQTIFSTFLPRSWNLFMSFFFWKTLHIPEKSLTKKYTKIGISIRHRDVTKDSPGCLAHDSGWKFKNLYLGLGSGRASQLFFFIKLGLSPVMLLFFLWAGQTRAAHLAARN